ncbi:ATP-binding protein [Streptomyces sp. NPDC000941]
MTASATTARAIRQMTAEVPVAYGADQETAENAMLVVSELISNADRACGPDALLFVEVYATDTGIAVTVHDPRGDLLPTRSTAAMDSSEAESGRGLRLLDELAPGWTTACSPIGKQIRCHVRPLGAA